MSATKLSDDDLLAEIKSTRVKLDALLVEEARRFGVDFNSVKSQAYELWKQDRHNWTVPVRFIRERVGMTLREAKDIVDAFKLP